jgi:hypothetical protein
MTVLGLFLGSLGTKSHSDVGAAERHKIYYMGEGGGFPRVRAVVSQVSPELPMACPSTKGAPECELTNLLVGLMQVRVSEYLVTLPSPIPELQHGPLPLLVLRAGSVPRVLHNFAT